MSELLFSQFYEGANYDPKPGRDFYLEEVGFGSVQRIGTPLTLICGDTHLVTFDDRTDLPPVQVYSGKRSHDMRSINNAQQVVVFGLRVAVDKALETA